MPTGLYRITCPVGLAWGEQDRMYPGVYAGYFRSLLTSTGAELGMIPDAGHMAPYEQPEAVLGALRSMLG